MICRIRQEVFAGFVEMRGSCFLESADISNIPSQQVSYASTTSNSSPRYRNPVGQEDRFQRDGSRVFALQDRLLRSPSKRPRIPAKTLAIEVKCITRAQ